MKPNEPAYRSAARVVLVTAFLLLIPLVAMQFAGGVVWSLSDFVVAGALLISTGFMYEFAVRKAGNIAYRVAVGVAAFSVLFLAWVILAVGLIGAEGDPFDLVYIAVVAVLIIGAIIARFQPSGMALALLATALAQAAVLVVALIAGKQNAPASSVREVVGVNMMFVFLFLVSAAVFRYSARDESRGLIESTN